MEGSRRKALRFSVLQTIDLFIIHYAILFIDVFPNT